MDGNEGSCEKKKGRIKNSKKENEVEKEEKMRRRRKT